MAAHPDNGRFHYQLGRAELALRDFDAARAEFERARDLGHTRAWYALGALTRQRGGRPPAARASAPAPAEALALYRAGVERGDPYAFHALGKQLLRYGDDRGGAARGIRAACRGRSSSATPSR